MKKKPGLQRAQSNVFAIERRGPAVVKRSDGCRFCRFGLVYYVTEMRTGEIVDLSRVKPGHGLAGPVACDCDAAMERGYLAVRRENGWRAPRRMLRIADVEEKGYFRTEHGPAFQEVSERYRAALAEDSGPPREE